MPETPDKSIPNNANADKCTKTPSNRCAKLMSSIIYIHDETKAVRFIPILPDTDKSVREGKMPILLSLSLSYSKTFQWTSDKGLSYIRINTEKINYPISYINFVLKLTTYITHYDQFQNTITMMMNYINRIILIFNYPFQAFAFPLLYDARWQSFIL